METDKRMVKSRLTENYWEPRTFTVRFWRVSSWPYSIDSEWAAAQPGAEVEQFEVSDDETYVKDGRRYYHCVTGHGTSQELLVE